MININKLRDNTRNNYFKNKDMMIKNFEKSNKDETQYLEDEIKKCSIKGIYNISINCNKLKDYKETKEYLMAKGFDIEIYDLSYYENILEYLLSKLNLNKDEVKDDDIYMYISW
jgi:hypothetical protein